MTKPSNAGTPLEESWEGLSLEELGKAYADVVGRNEGHDPAALTEPTGVEPEAHVAEDIPFEEPEVPDAVATLASIIEGALFIGHSDGRPVLESELAALMRDVTTDEIAQEIDRLNESYQQNDQALRIIRENDGVRLGVAADLETVRRAFYGKVREATLSQGAVEVLSLVAYQPGITGEKVQDQRGKESASLLSQLVRRRLLEQRRVTQQGEKRPLVTYYPTERFLSMFGLDSLDDLPHVEE
jgi:segregation and condensation protein B